MNRAVYWANLSALRLQISDIHHSLRAQSLGLGFLKDSLFWTRNIIMILPKIDMTPYNLFPSRSGPVRTVAAVDNTCSCVQSKYSPGEYRLIRIFNFKAVRASMSGNVTEVTVFSSPIRAHLKYAHHPSTCVDKIQTIIMQLYIFVFFKAIKAELSIALYCGV